MIVVLRGLLSSLGVPAGAAALTPFGDGSVGVQRTLGHLGCLLQPRRPSRRQLRVPLTLTVGFTGLAVPAGEGDKEKLVDTQVAIRRQEFNLYGEQSERERQRKRK